MKHRLLYNVKNKTIRNVIKASHEGNFDGIFLKRKDGFRVIFGETTWIFYTM